MVDALGMVASVTVSPQFVDVNVVEGIAPAAEMTMDFVPSELWYIVSVVSITFTQESLVMVMNELTDADLSPMYIVNTPVPPVT
jgi:hypothetical protein